MKTIGLIDVDFKRGTNIFNTKNIFPNLALMKISAYYKKKDYKVEWYSPLFHKQYDKIFASKVFTFHSKWDNYIRRKNIEIGGSGFDLSKNLPKEIEHIYPDYDLYENIDYAIGFITRGCVRKCPFCIVREKEGYVRKNTDLNEFWNDQEKIMLLDNNILGYKNHLEELEILINTKKKIYFNQGLDIRLITPENAQLLRKIKRWEGKRYMFAFDNPNIKDIIEDKLNILEDAGIKSTIISMFMLIGYNTTIEEDFMRLDFMRERKIKCYLMPFNKDIIYQKAMRKYINMHFYTKMKFNIYIEKYGTNEQKEWYRKNLKSNKKRVHLITDY